MTASSWADMNLIPIGLHSVEGISRLAASSVVSGLWQGLILASGAALCLRLVPKTTAAMRFMVWTAVFAVLALLPLFHAYLWLAPGAAAVQGAALQLDVRWSFAVVLLWLAISLVRGVNLLAGAVGLRAIWKRAKPVAAGPANDGALSAARFRGAQLCTSGDVDRPSVIGFFSPRILIPDELFDRLTPAELEQIVLHEVGHLRRADDWMNLLQKLSLVLVPLNPILMWIERRLCFERELACDEDVLLLTKAPKAYATCLTNLAEHRLGRKAAALSLGAWEKQSELARRVHSILRRGEGMTRLQARLVLGTVALVLFGGAAEMSRCPQFVSFSAGSAPDAAGGQNLPAVAYRPAATYQPVVFHSTSRASGFESAHESLLKAPVTTKSALKLIRQPNPQVTRRRKRMVASSQSPGLVRTRQIAAAATEGRQWMVLTSWSDGAPVQSGMIFAVSSMPTAATKSTERVFTSYAAVPTQAGWLVIQL